MSTQDDDLKLEPPEAQPPAPAPEPPVYQPPQPPPVYQPPQPPPAQQQPQGDLQPGAGRPLVEGPPMSVSEPISDSAINRTAAFAGLGLVGLGLVVALVVILVIVFAVCAHH